MNRLFMLTAAAAVLAGGSTAAGADGGYSVHRSANPVGQSGHAVRLGTSGDTDLGSFAGRRTVVSAYTKGSGISRSGSCKDASGQVVACGSAR
jgi:hypothetical protein